MSKNKREEGTTSKAAGNNKERYSIWPADRENAGRQTRGTTTETSEATGKRTGSKKASGKTAIKSGANSKKSTKSKR